MSKHMRTTQQQQQQQPQSLIIVCSIPYNYVCLCAFYGFECSSFSESMRHAVGCACCSRLLMDGDTVMLSFHRAKVDHIMTFTTQQPNGAKWWQWASTHTHTDRTAQPESMEQSGMDYLVFKHYSGNLPVCQICIIMQRSTTNEHEPHHGVCDDDKRKSGKEKMHEDNNIECQWQAKKRIVFVCLFAYDKRHTRKVLNMNSNKNSKIVRTLAYSFVWWWCNGKSVTWWFFFPKCIAFPSFAPPMWWEMLRPVVGWCVWRVTNDQRRLNSAHKTNAHKNGFGEPSTCWVVYMVFVFAVVVPVQWLHVLRVNSNASHFKCYFHE